jgi:hypothetical protein
MRIDADADSRSDPDVPFKSIDGVTRNIVNRQPLFQIFKSSRNALPATPAGRSYRGQAILLTQAISQHDSCDVEQHNDNKQE